MYRILFSGSLIVALALVGSAWGDQTWTGAVDNDWFNTGNWSGGALPTQDDSAQIGMTNPAPLIDGPGVVIDDMNVGSGGVGLLKIGPGADISTAQFAIGNTHDGTVKMSGGIVRTGVTGSGQIMIPDGNHGASGLLHMTGGKIELGASAYFATDEGTTARIWLDGGELFWKASSGLWPGAGNWNIDVSGGVLSVIGNVTGQDMWNHPIVTGNITGYGQAQNVFLDYNATIDKTFVRPISVPDFERGDVNRDGEINGLDVEPFVTFVTAGEYKYEADLNRDHAVNGLDVDLFVEAVVGPGGGVASVPEPSTVVLLVMGLLVAGTRRRWGRGVPRGSPGG